MNNMDLINDVMASCEDGLIKKQMAFMLGR
jgi:hypothetical protein